MTNLYSEFCADNCHGDPSNLFLVMDEAINNKFGKVRIHMMDGLAPAGSQFYQHIFLWFQGVKTINVWKKVQENQGTKLKLNQQVEHTLATMRTSTTFVMGGSAAFVAIMMAEKARGFSKADYETSQTVVGETFTPYGSFQTIQGNILSLIKNFWFFKQIQIAYSRIQNDCINKVVPSSSELQNAIPQIDWEKLKVLNNSLVIVLHAYTAITNVHLIDLMPAQTAKEYTNNLLNQGYPTFPVVINSAFDGAFIYPTVPAYASSEQIIKDMFSPGINKNSYLATKMKEQDTDIARIQPLQEYIYKVDGILSIQCWMDPSMKGCAGSKGSWIPEGWN